MGRLGTTLYGKYWGVKGKTTRCLNVGIDPHGMEVKPHAVFCVIQKNVLRKPRLNDLIKSRLARGIPYVAPFVWALFRAS